MKNTIMSHLNTWWAAHPIIKLATKHSEIGSQIIVAGSMLIRNLVHLIILDWNWEIEYEPEFCIATWVDIANLQPRSAIALAMK